MQLGVVDQHCSWSPRGVWVRWDRVEQRARGVARTVTSRRCSCTGAGVGLVWDASRALYASRARAGIASSGRISFRPFVNASRLAAVRGRISFFAVVRGCIARSQHSANADDAETAGSSLLVWTRLVAGHELENGSLHSRIDANHYGSLGRLRSPGRNQRRAALVLGDAAERSLPRDPKQLQ
jgi:hypothetical protein